MKQIPLPDRTTKCPDHKRKAVATGHPVVFLVLGGKLSVSLSIYNVIYVFLMSRNFFPFKS